MKDALRKLTLPVMTIAALLTSTALAQAEMVYNKGNGAEPGTLDPQKSDGLWEFEIMVDLYEPLVTYAANGEVVPGTADKWTMSDDGKTYTFNIRDNAKWSDGKPVTAHDFVYGMQRAVNPETAAPYASTLAPIVNASAITEGKEKDVSKLGVVATDDKTLVITLNDSTPYFLSQLRGGVFFPVRKDIIEKFGPEFTKPGNMVGNGAFTISEWVPNGSITATKNPEYWDAANVKLDKVVYYPTEDIAEELKRYRAGELHTTYEVPTEAIDMVKKEMTEEYKQDTQLGIYYYTINLEKEPLGKSLDLRRALSMAVDRDILTAKITQGGEIPAYSFVPNAPVVMGGYEPAYLDFKDKSQAERIAEAKKIFADAGYGPDKPLQVELKYNTSDTHKKIAVAIASMWKSLGVEVSLVNSETAQHYDSLEKRDFQIGRAGWIADFPDAVNFLDIFYSANVNNYAGLKDAKFDELLTKSRSDTDPAERVKTMHMAEQVALDSSPVIPLYYYASNHMVSTKVSGWEINGLDIHLSRYISVSE